MAYARRCQQLEDDHDSGGLLATPVHDTLKRADEFASAVEIVLFDDRWYLPYPHGGSASDAS